MLIAAAAAVLVALTPQTASANGCSPTTSTGSPLLSTTFTCTGTTLNQNNPSGFGSGHESKVIVNVASGATVQGSFSGINLGNDNTISNAGTISDSGSNPSVFFGVTTTGALNLTNASTGAILGTSSDPNANITLVLSQTSIAAQNDGTISATASGSTTTAFQATQSLSVTNTGTISASGSTQSGTFGLLAFNLTSNSSLTLVNSETISADGGTGLTGTAVEAVGSLNVTNSATGVIRATEFPRPDSPQRSSRRAPTVQPSKMRESSLATMRA